MDSAIAQSLASGVDPKAIAALKGHPNDPAVRRAVANQFSAMLMENLMKNSDGSPLAMVDGVGGDTVSALYTNVMSQVAASSNQLGFADLLLQSMPKTGAGGGATPAANGTAGSASNSTPTTPNPAPTAANPAAVRGGFSLQQYWQGRHIIGTPGAPFAIAPAPTGPHPVYMAPQGQLPGAGTPASSSTTPPAAGVAPKSPYDAPTNSSAQLSSPGDTTVASASRQQFAATLAPLLQSAAQSLGVSPNVLLAQAALESGWGRSMPGNNLFGVKAGAGWTGGSVQAYTHEATAGGESGQTASFRSYPNLAAAVADYVQLIANNARYRGALGAGNDPLAYGQALVAGGYATDPNYASKLAAVAASPTVTAALGAATDTNFAQAATTGGAA